MSRTYKVCIHGHPKVGTMEIFAIKPSMESYESFKEEIFVRKPNLKNREIRIYYTDAEDDRVTISTALDYAIFKESSFNRVFVAVTNDDVVEQSNIFRRAEHKRLSMLAGVMPTLPSTPLVSVNSTSVQKIVHANVVCDGCDGAIVGFRYKCMDCHDFDLCMSCESKMMHNHHVMLRIARPHRFNMDQLKKFRAQLGSFRDDDSKLDEDSKKKMVHHNEKQTSDEVTPPKVTFVTGEQVLCADVDSIHKAYIMKSKVEQDGQLKHFVHYWQTSIYKWVSDDSLLKDNEENRQIMKQMEKRVSIASHLSPEVEPVSKPSFTLTSEDMNLSTAPISVHAIAPANATSASVQSTSPFLETISSGSRKTSIPTSIDVNELQKNPKEVKVPSMKIANDEEDLPATALFSSDEDLGSNSSDSDDDGAIERALSKFESLMKDVPETKIVDVPESKHYTGTASHSVKTHEKSSLAKEWTLLNADDIDGAPKIPTTSIGAMPLVTDSVAHMRQTSPTPTKIASPAASKLVEQIIANMVQEDAGEPISPAAKSVQVALVAMTSMGFSNEGGWLTRLLECVDGDISRALILLNPQK